MLFSSREEFESSERWFYLENVITSSTSFSKNASLINSETETVSFIPVKLKNVIIIYIIKFHVFINDAGTSRPKILLYKLPFF